MITKFLFYTLLLVLLSVAAYWFASGSGDMVLQWQDYELTTTSSNFIFLVVGIIVLFAVVIPGFIGLFRLPKKWLKAREDKKFREGLDHITATLSSISLGDTKSAKVSLARVRKAYADLAIVPLLETQIAAATQDQALLQKSLNELQHYKQTKALASKGLAEMHMRRGELTSAIPFAERAMELEPKNKQSLLTTLSLYLKSQQYVYADGLIEDAKKQKLLDKHEYREYAALLAYLRSTQAELGVQEMRAHIESAYDFAPHKEHIFLRYIKLHNEGTSVQQSVRVLKRSWEGCFTPGLYHAAKELELQQKEKKKLYAKLGNLSLVGKPYANLLLAIMAAAEENAKDTHKYLKQYAEVTGQPLELPELGNDPHGALQEMIPMVDQLDADVPDTRWVCNHCSKESDSWQVICPSCQVLNDCKTLAS